MAVDIQTKTGIVQAAFTRFERERVRVPREEVEAAKTVHPAVTDFVRRELADIIDARVVGSWARKTQAGHLKDVDTLLMIDDRDGWWRHSAARALDRVASTAVGHPMVAGAEPRVRAVRLRLKDHPFWLDLVVGIEPTSGPGFWLPRHLPEETLDDWTLENPIGQVQAAADKNKTCDGIYVPSARIVKFWNQGEGKPFHSYHAESILWHALEGRLDYAEAVQTFFEAAVIALAPGAHVRDPGNPSKFVDHRLEEGERLHALDVSNRTLQLVNRAMSLEGDAALEAWVEVMGPAFPAPSTTSDALRQGLTAGATVAVSAGIRASTSGRPVTQPRSWRP